MIRRRYETIGETVLEETLPNGLRIFIFPKEDFEKNFAFFATDYGGMDTRFFSDKCFLDTPLGVAHFLEHKMFDTKDGNALQILSANGASPNAFTGAAITGYYFEGSKGFEANLETLLSFVCEPYFTKESVEKEQGIIGQEIQMIEDDPNWQVYTRLMQALYHTHPVRNSVAGSQESIAKITEATLYLCHEAFYHPANMVLCVAADQNPKRICDIATRILPKTGRQKLARELGRAELPTVTSAETSCAMEVARPIFQLGVKLAPAEAGDASLAQKLLADLLCEALVGSSSPLYTRLYEEGLINQSFFAGYDAYPGCAFLLFGGESRDPKAVREAIFQESLRLQREGIDASLFARLKKAAYGARMRACNSFEHLCVEQARAYFAQEEIWSFPEHYARIQKEDIERLLPLWLLPEHTALSCITPKEGET